MKPSDVSAAFARRTSEVRHSRRYSRFVGLMKVLLPTMAVVLIALIAAWPRLDGGDPGFRFSFSDLERDEQGTLGVTKARFAGSDSRQQPFVITAERAVQQQGFDVFDLQTLQADITTGNGTWISLSANRGEFRRTARVLTLLGGIEIFTNAGYELHGDQALIDLDEGTIATRTPIEGHGPLGAVRADALRYSSEDKVLNLSGRVRVILNPRREG